MAPEIRCDKDFASQLLAGYDPSLRATLQTRAGSDTSANCRDLLLGS